MESSDKVLACRAVDRGLAADRTVDLRQQSRRHLDEAAAALQDRAGKAGQVAHDSAAQRDDMIAAFDAFFQHPVGQALQLVPAFGAFARFDIVPSRCLARCGERGIDGRAPVLARVTISDHGNALLAQERGRMIRQIAEQTMADAHFVAASGKFDIDYNHASIASIIRLTVRWCGPSSVTMWIWA